MPLVFGIGLIMMTNNICDIERDSATGRQTMPVLLGRARSKTIHLCCSALWLFLVIVCVAFRFRAGLAPACLLLLAAFPIWRRLARLPLTPQQRGPCMGTIVAANLCANTTYVVAILIHVIKVLA
jgi:1,4-dihydroxy-2-naphthoate octaprenyltransferase